MESCRSLVACLNEGRNWRGTLVDVRADGRWGDPCSSGKDSDACGPYGRELIVFTHFPKAGGSAVGEKLAAAIRSITSRSMPPLVEWSRERIYVQLHQNVGRSTHASPRTHTSLWFSSKKFQQQPGERCAFSPLQAPMGTTLGFLLGRTDQVSTSELDHPARHVCPPSS